MRLLILGAGGQLGQIFMQQPDLKQWQYLALTREQLDITNAPALELLFKHYQPEIVLNCAAYTAVEQAELQQELCFQINTTAVGCLAKLCQQYQALLVQFSTDYVFDGFKRSPYLESDRSAPLNVYGQSKLNAEALIQQCCDRYFILRTSWLFSTIGHNFYLSMLRLAQQNKPLRVVDDQFGCPTYAPDLAFAVLQLLQQHRQAEQQSQQLQYGLYHLCSGPPVSWHQFAQQIFSTHGLSVSLQPQSSLNGSGRVNRPAYSALSNDKFRATFGISLRSWQQALIALALVE